MQRFRKGLLTFFTLSLSWDPKAASLLFFPNLLRGFFFDSFESTTTSLSFPFQRYRDTPSSHLLDLLVEFVVLMILILDRFVPSKIGGLVLVLAFSSPSNINVLPPFGCSR